MCKITRERGWRAAFLCEGPSKAASLASSCAGVALGERESGVKKDAARLGGGREFFVNEETFL